MKKSKKLAKISTAVIGIYLLFLVVIGVKTALLCHDFSKIGMIGIDLSAGAKNLDDYISGYAMVPGAFFTLLGSSFGGVIFFLLIFAIVFACVVQERKTANRCNAETGYGYCGTAVFSHFVKKCGSFLLDGCTSVDGHGRI